MDLLEHKMREPVFFCGIGVPRDLCRRFFFDIAVLIKKGCFSALHTGDLTIFHVINTARVGKNGRYIGGYKAFLFGDADDEGAFFASGINIVISV